MIVIRTPFGQKDFSQPLQYHPQVLIIQSDKMVAQDLDHLGM